MRKLVFLLLFSMSDARPQVLPVWHSFADVHNPQDGDTLDGKYAAIPYVEKGNGVQNGFLKFYTLRTITDTDAYSLQIYCRVPENIRFHVTAMVDTSVFGVLHSFELITADNQSPSWVDTTFEFSIPKGKSYYGDFHRIAIVRKWSRYQTYDSMYVDGVVLRVEEDTTVAPDTVRLSVAPSRVSKEVSGARYDVLGRRADKYTRVWFEQDSTGRFRLKRK